MSLTLRRTKGSQLTWDEVDANWTAGRTFDGHVKLGSGATAWDDLVMPLTAAKVGAVDKPAWDATELAYKFPRNDTSHILYLNCQFPHRWKTGSAISPHVHFHQNQAQAPTFKIDYRWTSIAGTVAAGWTTYTMDTAVLPYTSGTIHQLLEGAADIEGTGQGISSMLQIKLYRDDNVYVGDCLVTAFDIHYEIDAFGSDTEYSK